MTPTRKGCLRMTVAGKLQHATTFRRYLDYVWSHLYFHLKARFLRNLIIAISKCRHILRLRPKRINNAFKDLYYKHLVAHCTSSKFRQQMMLSFHDFSFKYTKVQLHNYIVYIANAILFYFIVYIVFRGM